MDGENLSRRRDKKSGVDGATSGSLAIRFQANANLRMPRPSHSLSHLLTVAVFAGLYLLLAENVDRLELLVVGVTGLLAMLAVSRVSHASGMCAFFGRDSEVGVMLAPAAGLVALAALAGLAPRWRAYSPAASAELQNRAEYASVVLQHQAVPLFAAESPHVSWDSGMYATVFAIAIAVFELFGGPRREAAQHVINPAVALLHRLHSGQLAITSPGW